MLPEIQWGSEIQTSLDFEWSKRGWLAISVDFKWDLKSGNLEAQPSELRTNGPHLFRKHLKSGQKRLDFEWYGFQMVGATVTI